MARWWWVLPLVYLVVSVIYQAFFFPFLPGGTERYHFETDCFILEIRFPLVLTVANQPGGEVSQPASFWLWRNSTWNATRCQAQALVSLTPSEPIDMVWLQNLKEGQPALLLYAYQSREWAIPEQVFVYLAPQEHLPASTTLAVAMDGNEIGRISATLWSASASGWFRLANLLLGSQNLALVTGAITLLTALYKFFQDAQARRQQQQKEFDAMVAEFEQRAMQRPERIAKEYLALLEKTSHLDIANEQREWLKQKYQDFTRQFGQGHIWARALRSQLVETLRTYETANTTPTIRNGQPVPSNSTSDAEDLYQWLNTAQEETGFLSDEQYGSVIRFQQDKDNQLQTFADCLRDGLHTFRALGTESAPYVIHRVKTALEQACQEWRRDLQNERLTPTSPRYPPEILNAFKQAWFDEGKAAGHYLLDQFVKLQPELRNQLLKWEEEDPAPPNTIKPPFGLWGRDPVYETRPEVLKLFGEPNPRWKHPFGPLKAEDDPRLPLRAGKADERPIGGLFWEEHPLWETLLSFETCFVTVPDGHGKTAMQLMGRHIRRFWGRRPALSLGFSLSGKPNVETLWHNIERALSEALRRDLVEDPYWLLSSEMFLQEWVISFFEHVYGDVWKLSSRLQEAGLPDEETDLVVSTLHAAAGRKAYQGPRQFLHFLSMLRQRLGESARYRLRDDHFEVFFWVEIQHADFSDAWLDLIAENGLLQAGIYKIFSASKTQPLNLRGTFTKHELTWTEEQLRDMLQYRFKQTKQDALLEMLDVTALIKEAHHSPVRLIQAGNRKIQELSKQNGSHH
ncbi:MAG: hypothetical protein DDG60_16615 [Anaerolineae bacterium]|nr:MAG: hypothetical protein DDG60_16615 [Anaerolineae bacterium]